ncbi:MAG TPA: SAM-dependent chlorinase/fluorinase [Actinomycetes bacterium]|nr:SAM-dependent chlorinase/fluorinase [Actinomycetes bacterium]
MQGDGAGALAVRLRVIGFASDFGTRDPYVGICHAVIARIGLALRVIDLGHEIPPGDIRGGAALVAQAAPFLPAAPVLLAVVDPGVGTDRAGLVVRTGADALLVGPDNGLLPWAAGALGGAAAAYAIENRALMLEPRSHTFHGRDVFAPVAARLALGLRPAEVGPPLPVEHLARLPDPVVVVTPGRLTAEILMVDRYGNLQTAARLEQLTAAVGEGGSAAEDGSLPGAADDRVLTVEAGDNALAARLGTTYGSVPPGEAVVYLDSAGLVAVARNGADAATALRVGAGDQIMISG